MPKTPISPAKLPRMLILGGFWGSGDIGDLWENSGIGAVIGDFIS